MNYQQSHIAYCSNVHPGQSLTQVTNNIRLHFAAVRAKRQINQMASGLWLSANAATELLSNDNTTSAQEKMHSFKEVLNSSGVLLTSLNGFPYGNFHQGVVKQDVYLPTWAQPERLTYSINIAKILAECLPESHCFGAISTLPLGYAKQWNAQQHQNALSHLTQLINELESIEKNTDKRICICIEMEPDCVLQSTTELVKFFVDDLVPFAESQGINKHKTLRYIGCCFDTCHQGVMNENIAEVLEQITQNGITIGKIQISNAVNAEIKTKDDIEQLTTLFKDEKFLHQTKVFHHNKLIAELDDLSEQALLEQFEQLELLDQHGTSDGNTLTAKIHYHIPINQTEFSQPFLSSTQHAIEETLDFLVQYLKNGEHQIPYLEIETYTWLNFLSEQSEANRTSTLHNGLVDEFTWLENALTQRNLLHIT